MKAIPNKKFIQGVLLKDENYVSVGDELYLKCDKFVFNQDVSGMELKFFRKDIELASMKEKCYVSVSGSVTFQFPFDTSILLHMGIGLEDE